MRESPFAAVKNLSGDNLDGCTDPKRLTNIDNAIYPAWYPYRSSDRVCLHMRDMYCTSTPCTLWYITSPLIRFPSFQTVSLFHETRA